jgi:hypothetical protein
LTAKVPDLPRNLPDDHLRRVLDQAIKVALAGAVVPHGEHLDHRLDQGAEDLRGRTPYAHPLIDGCMITSKT